MHCAGGKRMQQGAIDWMTGTSPCLTQIAAAAE
jgi:hypothetical protein